MPFARPTLQDLIDRSEAEFDARIPGADSRLRRSILSVLARALAGAVYGLYGFLDWLSRQLFPDTAETEFLDRWAGIWGVARKAGLFAKGPVNVTGANGTDVPTGSILVRSDGVEVAITVGATISGGSAVVTGTALAAGVAGNTTANTTLTFKNPVAGVDGTATVATGGIVGGEDGEDDESLRERLLARIQQAPHGGSAADYVTWAKEIAGVTRAWCLPQQFGAGTVGVIFVRDSDVSIIPDAGEISAVQAYIDVRRPVTAVVTVFAPTAVPLAFTIHVEPNTQVVKDAVALELADLIRREAQPGGTLLLSHIREAISQAVGENDYTMTAPSANVTVTATQLTTMGTITWT